jgi:iron complex transport system substrate-binding protein
MHRRLSLVLVVTALLAALCVSCQPGKSRPRPTSAHHRIISFAPSITETLFALGLGDRVVGVTRYCLYPPEAKEIPKIGGFYDPNYEAILTLQPDLVILLKEHIPLIEFLNKNGISYQTINNENVAGILESFHIIGNLCGKEREADTLADSLRRQLSDTLRLATKPRVLLCIGRDNIGSGSVSKIYAAGPRTFYNELLVAAGGVNVYADSGMAYPSLSGEGIVRLGPDIILDLTYPGESVTAEKMRADWDVLSMAPAVARRQVYCLSADYLTIPGPRIGKILDDFKGVLKSWASSDTAANGH